MVVVDVEIPLMVVVVVIIVDFLVRVIVSRRGPRNVTLLLSNVGVAESLGYYGLRKRNEYVVVLLN